MLGGARGRRGARSRRTPKVRSTRSRRTRPRWSTWPRRDGSPSKPGRRSRRGGPPEPGQSVAAARRDLAGGDAKGRPRPPGVPRRSGTLDDAGRAEAEALHAEALKIVAQEKRVADVGRLRAAGQRFDARVLAEALRDEAQGTEERARWEEARRAIQEEIQRDSPGDGGSRAPPPSETRCPPEARRDMMESPVWLTEDGRIALVLARGQERWVWVQLVDLPSRTIRADALLRAPRAAGQRLPPRAGPHGLVDEPARRLDRARPRALRGDHLPRRRRSHGPPAATPLRSRW